MKFLLVLLPLLAASMAQRPTYAGSGPKGRPGLASRFKDPNETSTVAVYNRIGEDGTTARVPVDARGDAELVDRLNQWPREHRPFWLLNADHIEASRNPQGNPQGNTQGNPQGNPQQNNLQSRFQAQDGNFPTGSNNDFDEPVVRSETRTIRPNAPRSSFLGALRR